MSEMRPEQKGRHFTVGMKFQYDVALFLCYENLIIVSRCLMIYFVQGMCKLGWTFFNKTSKWSYHLSLILKRISIILHHNNPTVYTPPKLVYAIAWWLFLGIQRRNQDLHDILYMWREWNQSSRQISHIIPPWHATISALMTFVGGIHSSSRLWCFNCFEPNKLPW